MMDKERKCCLCRIKEAKVKFEKYENFSSAVTECKKSVERDILRRFKISDVIIEKVELWRRVQKSSGLALKEVCLHFPLTLCGRQEHRLRKRFNEV